MKNDMNFSDHFGKTIQALSHGGAFLVAESSEGRVNVMTIGWGTLGVAWGKPIFAVLVRRSRHTFEAMNRGDSFTVNVPIGGFGKELLFCGTKSGRDHNKIKETGLVPGKSRKVKAPIIDQCQIHYECVTVSKKQMEKGDFLSPEIIRGYYGNDDHHMVFFGEIVVSYCDESEIYKLKKQLM